MTPVTIGGMKAARKIEASSIPFSKHLHTHFDQSLRYLHKRHNGPNEFWSDIPSDMKDGIHFTEIVGTPKECEGFYIECVPHAVIPVVTPLPDNIRPSRPKPTYPKPTDTVQPIVPIIQPNTPPTVIVPAVNNTRPNAPSSHHVSDEQFPWSASIYINGQLACNGILFDRLWVGVEGSCVTSVRYESVKSMKNAFPWKFNTFFIFQLGFWCHLCGAWHFEKCAQHSKSIRANYSYWLHAISWEKQCNAVAYVFSDPI